MATGLVSMENGDYRTQASITLDSNYDWFLTPEFQRIQQCKEKYLPQRSTGQDTPNDTILNEGIDSSLSPENPFRGGKISLHSITSDVVEKRREPPKKPMEQWTSTDFVLNACLYCLKNGGYKGPLIPSPDEYERHIVVKHPSKPAYPGPADIKLYGLELNGNGRSNANGNDKSKVAEKAQANRSGNGIMPVGNGQQEQKDKEE